MQARPVQARPVQARPVQARPVQARPVKARPVQIQISRPDLGIWSFMTFSGEGFLAIKKAPLWPALSRIQNADGPHL